MVQHKTKIHTHTLPISIINGCTYKLDVITNRMCVNIRIWSREKLSIEIKIIKFVCNFF